MVLLSFFDVAFLSFLYMVFIVLMIYLWIFLIKEIRQIARNSKRNVTMWTIIAIVMSPFIGTILLTCFELCRVIKESHPTQTNPDPADGIIEHDVQTENR